MSDVDVYTEIKDILKEIQPATRKELCKALKDVPRSTVYDRLVILEKYGEVRRYNFKENNGRGRPNVVWEIDDDSDL